MNGIIVIDKPAGPTSAEIVRQLKARLGKRTRVGHLGTLDPFATGVLPILVGEGTKLAPFLQEGTREYAGLFVLGRETDTLDSTGKVSRIAPVPTLHTAQLAAIANRFTGTIEQTPPIFSAIKRGGVPLYKLARRGIQVDPPQPRRIEIRRLELKRPAMTPSGSPYCARPGCMCGHWRAISALPWARQPTYLSFDALAVGLFRLPMRVRSMKCLAL